MSTNNKNSNCFLANFYYSELSEKWLKEMCSICDEIEGRFGLKFNYGNFLYEEIGKKSKKTSARNCHSLFDDATCYDTDKLSSIYLSMAEKKNSYSLAEFNYYRKLNSYRPYYQIYIMLNLCFINNINSNIQDAFMTLLKQFKRIGKMEYGFLHAMPASKLPLAYFSGISNNELTNDENNRLRIWKGNKQKYKELIWDVFLGNIIKENILNNNIISEIKSIVGCTNVYNWDDIVIFFLPCDLDDWIIGNEKALKIQSELIELFKSNNLLMEYVTR